MCPRQQKLLCRSRFFLVHCTCKLYSKLLLGFVCGDDGGSSGPGGQRPRLVTDRRRSLLQPHQSVGAAQHQTQTISKAVDGITKAFEHEEWPSKSAREEKTSQTQKRMPRGLTSASSESRDLGSPGPPPTSAASSTCSCSSIVAGRMPSDLASEDHWIHSLSSALEAARSPSSTPFTLPAAQASRG